MIIMCKIVISGSNPSAEARRRPVTSLELFDAAGETIALFFVKRRDGRQEPAVWRKTIDQVTGDAPGQITDEKHSLRG